MMVVNASSMKDSVNEGIPEGFLYIHPVNNQCNQCNLAHPQFRNCFIKGFQFPHCVIKGPQNFPFAPSGAPFPHHVIKMMTSNSPSGYQEALFPPSRPQRDPNFQNTP